jgi:probable rRNA maturation factor
VVRAFDETSGPAPGNGRVDTERWSRLARAVLRDEGIGSGELGLRFVDTGAMAELNLAHMATAGPTDVLAFPIDGGRGGGPASEPAVLLGDVVVCPAYAACPAHASRAGREPAACGARPTSEPDDELALLVVHGVLHVLGYDHAHEAEAAAMQTREQQLLAAHHRQP